MSDEAIIDDRLYEIQQEEHDRIMVEREGEYMSKRELKFRAWDGNRFIKWEELKSYPFKNIIDKLGYVLEQFTGLKAKNGVEIYEGDKVEGLDFENHIVVEGVFFDSVQWHPFAGQRALRNVEVIGNIHE